MIARIWKAALLAGPLRLWAMILGAVALTAGEAALTLIIWLGGWPERLADLQLHILGAMAIIKSVLIGAIVVSLANVKLSGRGPGGLQIEIDADGQDAPAATVTTTTETTIEGAAPADQGDRRRSPRGR